MPERFQFSRMVIPVAATLAQGTSDVSEVIDLGGVSLVGIQFPAVMSATNLAIYGAKSLSDPPVPIVNDLGTALRIVVTVGSIVLLTAEDLVSLQFIAFKPNNVEVAERTLDLILRSVK